MNPSVKIGNKEQVFSSSVVAKNNDSIQFEFEVPSHRDYSGRENPSSKLKCEISFQVDESGQATGDFIATDAGGVKFTFKNWNSNLGMVTTEPVKFGEVGTKKLYLNLANYSIGEVNICHLSVLLG